VDCGLPKMINIGIGWGTGFPIPTKKLQGMGNNMVGTGRGWDMRGRGQDLRGGDGDDLHPHAGLYTACIVKSVNLMW